MISLLLGMTLVSNAITGKISPSRNIDKIKGIVIHRIDVGETAAEIAAAFADTRPFKAGSYTNAYLPYTFIIRRDGTVEQMRELNQLAMHSIGYNTTHVGIALVGDFRKKPPTPLQWQSLIDLCSDLAAYIGPSYEIVAHDKLKGGMRDISKKCPGEFMRLDKLREIVEERRKIIVIKILTQNGITIG